MLQHIEIRNRYSKESYNSTIQIISFATVEINTIVELLKSSRVKLGNWAELLLFAKCKINKSLFHPSQKADWVKTW